jgi:putative heme-binding domain-containing protein
MRAVPISCFVLAAAGTLLAQQNYSPGDVEDGRRLYIASCAVCHGPEGESVPGVELDHGKFRHGTSDDELIDIIRKGIPGTAMPPHTFTMFQARSVVAYLRFMAASPSRGPASTGDAVHGKAIFESKGCLNCHRVNGNGARLGPELTDIGSLRRAAELERSILEPDAEVLPQNRFIRVVTREGVTINGRLLNQDAFTIQLYDTNDGLVSLEKSKLKEYAFTNKSPMLSFRGKLSPQELSDLVSYLVSLKGIDKQ